MPALTKGYYVALVKKGDKMVPGDAESVVEQDIYEDDLWAAAGKWPDQWFLTDPRKAPAAVPPVAAVGSKSGFMKEVGS